MLGNMAMTVAANGLLSHALLFVLVLLPTTAAQEGFLSIDCGSTRNYTDTSTGVEWKTDDGYISSGVNREVKVDLQSIVRQQMGTARYFLQSRKKHCYALPTAENSSYLIRAFFHYGDLEASPPPGYTFNLSINSNIVQNMSMLQSDPDKSFFIEFMVPSVGNQIDFCIIPVVGTAFISSLELRPLNPNMYLGLMFKSKYIKGLDRYNFCRFNSDPWFRFPDDTYDRLWQPFGTVNINTTAKVVIPSTIYDAPPQAVMQTAWEISGTDVWFYMPASWTDTSNYFAALYFADVGSPDATDVRSIDAFINGETLFTGLNVTKNAIEFSMDQLPTIADTGSANFSFAKNPTFSTLNPLLNAIEFHGIYDFDFTTTSSGNVAAINDLRQKLNLLDWTGDPCLPVSWDWINCSSTSPPEITQIDLSDFQLTGIFPTSVAELTSLTDLWLDNNNITGAIPTLTSLTKLRTLHLQNNSLTGPIPADLADIPSLSQLYLSNNQLSGPVPASLSSKNGLDLRVDGQRSSNSPGPDTGKKSSGTNAGVIGGIIGAVVAVIIAIGLAVFLCLRSKNRRKTQSHPETSSAGKGSSEKRGSHHAQSTRAFSVLEVEDATSYYKRKIGEGGFGPVYYGKLPMGEEVAVKVNKATSGQGFTEFSTEVSLLSRVHHRNLVSLVGFCEEDDKKILVYRFMPNGTLREHLYGRGVKRCLDWPTRLNIALDAARGLEYLHYDCTPKIIHRDVKSTNILLDENLQAKVADFGISKLAPDEDITSGFSTELRGTAGYLDPEFINTRKITQKSDVYAFGVVLLEIISGRAPNDNNVEMAKRNLVQYARGNVSDGNLEAMVDPKLEKKYNVEAMWKLVELAMYCVEPLGGSRPDMRQVVSDIVEAISFQRPQETPPTTVTYNFGTQLSHDNFSGSYPSQLSTGTSHLGTATGTKGSSSDHSKDSSHFPAKAPPSSHVVWSRPKAR